MSADSKTVSECCPVDQCAGMVSVEIEYESADPNWGADADGRRGFYMAGYWGAVPADTCSLGCVLDADAKVDVAKDAMWQAEHDREDEYHGPDGPDDDY